MKNHGWQIIRRNKLLFLACMVLFVGSVMVWHQQQVKIEELSYIKSTYDQKEVALKKEVDRLAERAASLGTDQMIESLARQKLKMIKKDEIQYIIKEAQ